MTQATAAQLLDRARANIPDAAVPLVSDADEAALTTEQDKTRERLAVILAALLAGRIGVDVWERLTALEIGLLRKWAFVTMLGTDTFTDVQSRVLTAQIQRELGYLAGWRAELEAQQAANALPSEAALTSRLSLYITAAIASLFAGASLRYGFLLPAYPGDGSTRCRVNCKCRWVLHKVGDRDWDCYWRLGIAEDHCETCPRRALMWNPIQVRNGVLQPYPRAGLFI